MESVYINFIEPFTGRFTVTFADDAKNGAANNRVSSMLKSSKYSRFDFPVVFIFLLPP